LEGSFSGHIVIEAICVFSIAGDKIDRGNARLENSASVFCLAELHILTYNAGLRGISQAFIGEFKMRFATLLAVAVLLLMGCDSSTTSTSTTPSTETTEAPAPSTETAAPGTEAAGESPCGEDAQKFCADVQAGEGRIVKCLADHADEVTAACRKSLGL
jgi:hypothetical protein